MLLKTFFERLEQVLTFHSPCSNLRKGKNCKRVEMKASSFSETEFNFFVAHLPKQKTTKYRGSEKQNDNHQS